MMVVGLSYRLIPMILPAAMPSGRALAASAVFMEAGVIVLTITLLAGADVVWAGALLILLGLVSFVTQIRRTVRHRLPRPPALPQRDWSAWQAHASFLWLLVAAGLGAALSVGVADEHRLTLMWIYGVSGLVGFLAQIVTGMQGRLVPLYAWYRAFARKGAPPERAANALPSSQFAGSIFGCWTVGVPLLAWGLPTQDHLLIRLGAMALATGVVIGAVYMIRMLRAAKSGG
jgi:hypothetical protein